MASRIYKMTKFSRLFCALQVSRYLARTNHRAPLIRRLSFLSSLPQLFSPDDEILKINFTSTSKWLQTQRNCSSLSTNDSCTKKIENTQAKGHPNRRTLFVGSLNYLTSEEKLKDHFSQYGEVERLRILHNKSSRIPNNYAFVQFKTVESIERALEGKNFVDSRWLNVRKHDYDAKIESKIHIKDIPSDLHQNDIKEHFSQFGTVDSITIPMDGNTRRDFGFIAFSSEDSVLKALEQSRHNIKGNAIQASTFIAKRRRTIPGRIVVDFLPDNITVEDIKTYFEEFGALNSIDMVFHRDAEVAKNFAFLAFQDENIPDKISKDNKKHFIHGHEVIVQPMFSLAKIRAMSREKKVFVEGIPLGKTENDICSFFNQFGDALHVHLIDSWAKRHGNQCGILRFKKKEEVDSVTSQSEILMDGFPLTVRKLGYTATTSSDYTPLYFEFSKKHRLNPNSTKGDPSVVEEQQELEVLHQYPDLK